MSASVPPGGVAAPVTVPTGGDPEEPARTSWPAVVIAVVAGFGVAAQVGKLVVALPVVSVDLGIGPVLGGAVLAAFATLAALVGATVGAMVARVGPARAVATGLGVVVVGSALGALTTSGVGLLATTALEGAGYVAVVAAVPTLVARATAPADRGAALAVCGTYYPGGQALMIMAGPALLAAAGWRGLWWASAGVLAVCAVLAAVVQVRGGAGRPSPSGPGDLHVRGVLDAARDPASRTLALAFGLHSLQFIAVTGFLPTVYRAQGISPGTGGVLAGLVVAANVLGNLAASVLLRRGVRHWLLIAVAASTTGPSAVAVFAFDLPFAATYACALTFSLAGGLLPATVLAAVPVYAPTPASVPLNYGLVVQAIGLGSVVGPLATGALAQAVGGWHATPLVVTTAAAGALLLALRLRRPGHLPFERNDP